MAKLKLDKEEKELLESYERGEWKSVKNLKEEQRKLDSDWTYRERFSRYKPFHSQARRRRDRSNKNRDS